MAKTVIFDFDGTIADSFDLFVETSLKIVPDNVDKTISPEDLRGLSVKEILKKLKIKRWNVPKFVVQGRKEMSRSISGLKSFEGLADVLAILKKQNISVCILSSNSKDSIETFLQNNKLSKFVDQTIGDVGIFGKAKAIKKLVKSLGNNRSEFVYVGDEVRDVAAAKKAGIQSIAVTWGFNNKKILQKSDPDFLVDSPSELCRVIAELV